MKTLGEVKEPDPRLLSRPPQGEAASFACRAYCLKNILRKDKENIVLPLRWGGRHCVQGKGAAGRSTDRLLNALMLASKVNRCLRWHNDALAPFAFEYFVRSNRIVGLNWLKKYAVVVCYCL